MEYCGLNLLRLQLSASGETITGRSHKSTVSKRIRFRCRVGICTSCSGRSGYCLRNCNGNAASENLQLRVGFGYVQA